LKKKKESLEELKELGIRSNFSVIVYAVLIALIALLFIIGSIYFGHVAIQHAFPGT